MKNKLTALILVLTLSFSLLSGTAWAVDDEDLTDAGYVLLDTEEDFSVWTKSTNTDVSPKWYAWSGSNGQYDSGNTGIKNSFSNLAILCSSSGTLKFDWVVGSIANFGFFAYRLNADLTSSGAVTGLANNSYTGDESGSENGIVVEEGDVLYLTFFKNNFDRHDLLKDGATVSNIRLVKGGNITLQSSDDTLGTVSTADALENLEAGTVITVTATAAEGQFAGWYETIGGTTRLVSMETVFEYTVSEDAVLEARFIELADNAVATFNGVEYSDLQAALDAAGASGNASQVILQQNAAVDDLEIPANVTLLIPYAEDDEGVDFNSQQKLVETVKKGLAYRTLTVNGNLTVKGTILVNGRLGSSSTAHQGSIAGDYGRMILNGVTTVESGGAFKVVGMVTGNGEIIAENGSAVYQPFEITDWPGGSTGLGLYTEGQEFPINQYYIQNIQVALTLEYGSSMNAYAYLLVPSSSLAVQVTMEGLIGPTNKAFFQMNEGSSLSLEYVPDTYQTAVTVHGDVSLKAFSISAAGQSISTENVICPIPGSFSITAAEGATVSIENDFKLLPGAELIVEDGASLTIADGATIEVYGADDFTPFFSTYREVPNTSSESRVTPDTGAHVVIDGELINNGTIKVSDTEEGLVDTTDAAISGSGEIKETSVGKLVLHYQANGGEGTMADQRLTYGMSGKLNKNTFTKAGHDFRGWSAKNDVDYNPLNGSASLIDDEVSFALLPNVRIDELTLYAMWAENGAIVYTVSFLDEDGETVLVPAKTVEANDAVVRPDDPEKDGFDFDGWYNGETAYDFDAPVTGNLTLTAHWTAAAPAQSLTEEDFVDMTKAAAAVAIDPEQDGVFTVTCPKACVVIIETDKGGVKSYEKVLYTEKVAENTYSFEAHLTEGQKVLVALKGDINGDGGVDLKDAMLAMQTYSQAYTATALEQVIGCFADGPMSLKDAMIIMQIYSKAAAPGDLW